MPTNFLDRDFWVALHYGCAYDSDLKPTKTQEIKGNGYCRQKSKFRPRLCTNYIENIDTIIFPVAKESWGEICAVALLGDEKYQDPVLYFNFFSLTHIIRSSDQLFFQPQHLKCFEFEDFESITQNDRPISRTHCKSLWDYLVIEDF
jgi:hypothetical protein